MSVEPNVWLPSYAPVVVFARRAAFFGDDGSGGVWPVGRKVMVCGSGPVAVHSTLAPAFTVTAAGRNVRAAILRSWGSLTPARTETFEGAVVVAFVELVPPPQPAMTSAAIDRTADTRIHC